MTLNFEKTEKSETSDVSNGQFFRLEAQNLREGTFFK
jgi:hypothetical protein